MYTNIKWKSVYHWSTSMVNVCFSWFLFQKGRTCITKSTSIKNSLKCSILKFQIYISLKPWWNSSLAFALESIIQYTRNPWFEPNWVVETIFSKWIVAFPFLKSWAAGHCIPLIHVYYYFIHVKSIDEC